MDMVTTGSAGENGVTLAARPEALRLAPQETAVVVIDMQNAYASEGGYVDLAGFDISGAAGVIGKIATVLHPPLIRVPLIVIDASVASLPLASPTTTSARRTMRVP